MFAAQALPDLPATDVGLFLDWVLDCKNGCEMRAIVRGTQPNDPEILRLTVQRAGKASDLTVSTPLPLYLPDSASLIPEDGVPIPMPWYTCASAGCEARLLLDPTLTRALRRARVAEIEMTLLDRTRVRVPVSLLGFTAALRQLEIRSAP